MRLKKEEMNECEDVPNALVTSNIRQYIAKLNKKTKIVSDNYFLTSNIKML